MAKNKLTVSQMERKYGNAVRAYIRYSVWNRAAPFEIGERFDRWYQRLKDRCGDVPTIVRSNFF